MATLRIGTASAKPGEIGFGRLKIGELRDGTRFGLPVAAINGARDGPLLYIQAGSDGDELNGIGVVRKVITRLDPKKLSGSIFVVSPLNFHGFQQDAGHNPLDNKKTNRTFPGKQAGSITERLAYAVFRYIKKCDLALDLHQGGTSRMIDEVRVRVSHDHERYRECLELAKVFGISHIFDKEGPKGQLSRVAPGKGIPTINPELGGCVGWDKNSIRKGVQGVFNVLFYYRFLSGKPQLPEEYIIVSDLKAVYADKGGLIEFVAHLYDRVTTGDTIFTITDMFGNVKQTVESPVDGILWRKRRLPMVATGESVCSLGIDIRTEGFNPINQEARLWNK